MDENNGNSEAGFYEVGLTTAFKLKMFSWEERKSVQRNRGKTKFEEKV